MVQELHSLFLLVIWIAMVWKTLGVRGSPQVSPERRRVQCSSFEHLTSRFMFDRRYFTTLLSVQFQASFPFPFPAPAQARPSSSVTSPYSVLRE